MSNYSMLAGLVSADVRFVVIGGVAAILHGSPRNTNDLDICYDPAADNVGRLAGRLQDWHAYLRGVEPGLPWVLDARAIRVSPVLTLKGSEGWIDIMDRVQGVGDWPDVHRASIAAVWDELRFRILSLDALIAAKRSAGRAKDHDMLAELEALREIRKDRGLE